MTVTRGTVHSKRPMKAGDWVGVDLDGTLAEYEKYLGPAEIGPPIMPMVERVKRWLAEGKDVRIFTARIAVVWHADMAIRQTRRRHALMSHAAIEKWCVKHIGCILPITNVKDQHMHELWDDRAVRVIFNTGERADGVQE